MNGIFHTLSVLAHAEPADEGEFDRGLVEIDDVIHAE